jgi:hypothetical protein
VLQISSEGEKKIVQPITSHSVTACFQSSLKKNTLKIFPKNIVTALFIATSFFCVEKQYFCCD